MGRLRLDVQIVPSLSSAELNLQLPNPRGISWMLSVPCATGVTKLLSLHQLGCAGRLDSAVKSSVVLSASLSLNDELKGLKGF